jgi:hypothetical protein
MLLVVTDADSRPAAPVPAGRFTRLRDAVKSNEAGRAGRGLVVFYIQYVAAVPVLARRFTRLQHAEQHQAGRAGFRF